MKKYILAVLVLSILLSGCFESPQKKGTSEMRTIVNVNDVRVKDVLGSTMYLEVGVIVNNPNPVGAHLTKMAFDIYYLKDGLNYLGHGEKHDIDIRKQGNTNITIPVTVDNTQAVKAFAQLAQEETVKTKIDGSAHLRQMVSPVIEIPFEETKEVTLSQGTLPKFRDTNHQN